jgi:hypothetical protein
MAQVKSYYADQLELGQAPEPDSIMSIDEQEDILYELLLDEINLVIQEAAELDKIDLLS